MVDVDSLDSKALGLECAAETHEPLMITEGTVEGESVIYGYVRTTSFHLDGCGGRTDIHDVWSALWAGVLRANGIASSWLIDEVGWCGAPELSGRYLFFEQIAKMARADCTLPQLFKAHTALAFHLLADSFMWAQIGYPNSTWTNDQPPFLPRVLTYIKASDIGDVSGRRHVPDWLYARSEKAGISIVVFPIEQAVSIRFALANYNPKVVVGEKNTSILAVGLRNAIPNSAIKRAVKVMGLVEKNSTVPWKGACAQALDRSIVIIPLESHFLMLGLQTLLIVRADCGIRKYEAERTQFLQRREAEDAVFYTDCIFTWEEIIDGAVFEELVYALLEREPGVKWIRPSGPTRERDAGRDFISQMIVPTWEGVPAASESAMEDHQVPIKILNVVVQAKFSSAAVGKSKVRDIRDTVERHSAAGFFLVAFPQPANSLVEHLSILAKNGVWTNWWDRAQLESRLRCNRDIVTRFASIVRARFVD